MNKSQLMKIITNLQTYVDGKINKLPASYKEKLLITVPKESIDKSKADAATNGSPYTIQISRDNGFEYVEGMFNNTDMVIEYNGEKRICRLTKDGPSVVLYGEFSENNIFGVVIPKDNSDNIKLSILKLDTTNITDIKVYMRKRDINIDDLTIDNSISMGRTGGIGINSSALGFEVEASGIYSHAEGCRTSASSDSSHVEGSDNTASGIASHAEGSMSGALGDYSHSEGSNTIASGNSSHAEGFSNNASGDSSHAEGQSATASGDSSHAEGFNTTASESYSHAEGNTTTASAKSSHAEGHFTTAQSQYQHVQGKYNIGDSTNKYAHIVGNGKYDDQRSNAHTLDWNGNAWYQGSVYTGGTSQDDTNAKKLATEEYVNNNISSIVVPTKTSDLTNDSGFLTSIPNEYITEDELTAKNYIDNTTLESKGYLTEHQDLSGYAPIDSPNFTNAISMGRLSSSTIGKKSTALGNYVQATADCSHAEGQGSIARGNYSHAEGSGALSEGIGSHAENTATARGDYSHAEGSGEAIGVKSHAEGNQSKANAEGSHAEGYNTLASGQYQHVQGKYNVEDTTGTYAHIIGNGTGSGVRSNAHTVDWNGNAWYKGDVYIGGTNQETNAKKLATESYVNNKVSGLVDSAPETLDTLKELATALGNDPNFATTISNQIGNKVDKVDGKGLSTNDLTDALKSNYDAAYAHSQSAHAPSNAQKNSDITKAEIEAKLTGNVTTHTHSQYLTKHQDISGLALKSELHTHTNKAILDAITSDKINSWDSKSTFSGSYKDLADKPTIPSVEGFATESYVDSKFLSEEIIFEGQSNDPLVLHDYYTHVPIADGMGFWVINKTIEINSSNNPYIIEISGSQGKDGVYGPNVSTFNSTYNMWVYDLGNGDKLQMGNIEYNGSPALAVAWDTAGSYSNLKITKRIDLMNTINSKVDKAYVDGKVSDLVNSSPEALNTLKELADALGNDPNFATTVSNQIGNKVDKVSGKGLSTNDLTNTLKANYDAAYNHSKSAHAPSNAQKNSDITKAEIEAKLTGNITTHTHSQYLTSIPSEYITEQELTSKGYITEDVLTSKGYITEDVLTSKGYATESQINSAVEAAATTDEEVKTTVNQILGGVYIE